MKEACTLLTYLATEHSERFDSYAHRYVSEDCLIKALNNGKKVIVDLAHECILSIVNSTTNAK